MDYISITPSEREEMLGLLGYTAIDDLFRDLPKNAPFPAVDFPSGETELTLLPALRALASENLSTGDTLSFLGGGAYAHFIPTTVDYLTSRGEFATAYTPYQPEVSQGTLQAIFEFQSFVAALAELPIANASLYDGASAFAEGILMAHRVTKRSKVLVLQSVHPHYLAVVKTYLSDLPLSVEVVPFASDGTVDLGALDATLSEEVAVVALSQPNFLGCLEDLEKISERVHAVGGLVVVNAFPVSLGLLGGPGAFGADVVTMEGQSLGVPLSYGGPYVGLFACREAYARFMPGRVAGETVDQEGKRGYVLTLQTREQHIRRERATSNICTNQALMALRVLVYLSLMGRDGLKKRANLCFQKAHYLKQQLAKLPQFTLPFSAPTFSEFVVQAEEPFEKLATRLREQKIFPGIPLATYFPGLPESDRQFLVSVTECHTKEDLDRFVTVLSESR